ncbi:hypothetical protein [Paraburkholderia caledonica]|uniref:hypothetical protein n=1 Tax=Paraburkholderia caledonica TaxID=134536 RepID=UPI0038B8EFEB
MRRISTATRVIDKFGAGKDGFTNGDAVSGLPSTDLEDVWFDHVQEEIANVIEASGQTLNPADRTQLKKAVAGRLLRTSVYAIVSGQQQVSVNGAAFTTTGATVFTPLSGTNTIIGEAQGGGGGGGGASGAGATTVSMGAPGGSGSYGKAIWAIGVFGASQSITVGAGGVGAVSAGANGATSSIGTLLTSPGGIGGGISNNVTPPSVNGNGSFSSAVTGTGILYSCRGIANQVTMGLSTSSGIGGNGGSSQFGTGANGPGINTNGASAVNYGTGGSGVVVNQSGGNGTGGSGFAGIVIISEYA